VLAVSGQAYVWLGWQPRQVKTLLTAWPEEGWTRLSAGDGTKGPRWYDWHGLPLAEPLEPHWRRWLLVRRSMSAPKAVTASGVCAPQGYFNLILVRGQQKCNELCCTGKIPTHRNFNGLRESTTVVLALRATEAWKYQEGFLPSG
jgi:hypothetical protein